MLVAWDHEYYVMALSGLLRFEMSSLREKQENPPSEEGATVVDQKEVSKKTDQANKAETPVNKNMESSGHGEQISSDDWEMISQAAGGSQILETESSGLDGSSHLLVDSPDSTVLAGKASHQNMINNSTDGKDQTGGIPIPENHRSRAVSAAESESSCPGLGIFPPPGTPDTRHHDKESVDAMTSGQRIWRAASQDGANGNAHSASSIRKNFLIGAAADVEDGGNGLMDVSKGEMSKLESITEEPLAHSLSQIFTSEEWQSLQDSLRAGYHHRHLASKPVENVRSDGLELKESPETGVGRGGPKTDLDANVRISSAKTASLAAPKTFKDSQETQSLHEESSGDEDDFDQGVKLTRSCQRSSVSEPATWGESSIGSVQSQGSSYIPRSMVAGTVLSADSNPFVGEHMQTQYAKRESNASLQTQESSDKESAGGISLAPYMRAEVVAEKPQEHTSISSSNLPRLTIPTSTNSSPTKHSASTASPSKDSEGGVTLVPPSPTPSLYSPQPLTKHNLALLSPEPLEALTTYSTVSVASGNPGRTTSTIALLRQINRTMSADSFTNIGDELHAPETLETATATDNKTTNNPSTTEPGKAKTHGKEPEEEEEGEPTPKPSSKAKGKARALPPTFSLPMRPSTRPDPTGSPGSSKNAPGPSWEELAAAAKPAGKTGREAGVQKEAGKKEEEEKGSSAGSATRG